MKEKIVNTKINLRCWNKELNSAKYDLTTNSENKLFMDGPFHSYKLQDVQTLSTKSDSIQKFDNLKG